MEFYLDTADVAAVRRLAGCSAITVDPGVAELFLMNPVVEDALNRFDRDWAAAYGAAAGFSGTAAR